MTNTAMKAAQLATTRCHFKEPLNPEDVGFSSNIFMVFGLPAQRLKGNPAFWTKDNNLYKLAISRHINYEIPTGCYARMNQIFIDTEVKTKNTNVIEVGRSFYEYAKKLGYTHGGAERELIKQLVNYVTSRIDLTVVNNELARRTEISALVSNGRDFFFDVKNPDQLTMSSGRIVLSEDYARYIHHHAAPLDLEVVRAFKNNPIALDFYRFLAYRCNTLNKTIEFPDHLLFEQLGVGHSNNRMTRARLKLILRNIQSFWPGLRAKFEAGQFILEPSDPAIKVKLARRSPLSITHTPLDRVIPG